MSEYASNDELSTEAFLFDLAYIIWKYSLAVLPKLSFLLFHFSMCCAKIIFLKRPTYFV